MENKPEYPKFFIDDHGILWPGWIMDYWPCAFKHLFKERPVVPVPYSELIKDSDIIDWG